ncbi:MAG TPA: hypothetical protein VEA80_10000 [Vitreimonas sp.]|uniref:hypothetical protein n=1 Tax=Vitreimonas sp. TaxID=3069702 RepID=UPI002D5CC265|nr:hypothetical protein [Vitreimonas sp.]HYD87797.1 hypothetical protein [Vitreimonas sp.]
MTRKFLSLFAALAVAATSFAPAAADARDRRGGYYHGDRHGHHYRHHRRDRDDDDAVVAGVVGLALGLAIGSLASQDNRRDGCYDRCAPPPNRYYGYDEPPVYYDDDYYEPRVDYDDGYERCDRQERVWDRQTQRYVIMDAC